MAKSKYEYVKSFELADHLLPHTWIVVRIDGRSFHRFSKDHQFKRPNDEQALRLMNECAKAVMEDISDIVFAYGVSDEYSFVFRKTSSLYERRSSKLMSILASLFASTYVMKWSQFFPDKKLQYAPCFDGRAVCYPTEAILLDYLAWRQVDCHINNQYNTCLWMLVEAGKSSEDAQKILKGTQADYKNELLYTQFGINYSTLPEIFRKGSSLFRRKEEEIVKFKDGLPIKRIRSKVVVEHCDIISQQFWEEHAYIIS
ncbi:hypothetical protein O6H91_07G019600 [Diphasiastrum complanatum]|uniref:Uncharacterized protein n=1 Tax=Diphasiastrum complanatum TaxID=34168 RepID=A0ACC2D3B7_DIPCM|nr:hypothetical protein O6H91_07G019600 [Diphasiastrum complanatum]